jgi:hypothetical protein
MNGRMGGESREEKAGSRKQEAGSRNPRAEINSQAIPLFHTCMSDKTKLILIKLLHTMIWLFFNVVIFYLLYAVLVNKIDKWVWICLGLIVLEGLVLVLFKRVCPVTLMARKYSDSTRPNFDIYLPGWLARYNQLIYSIIVLIAVVILIYRYIAGGEL